MPSPIGHALAGVAVAWSAEQLPGSAGLKRPFSPAITGLCAALAAAPDLDLLYSPIHRTMTHSVGAILLVFIVATVVTRWVTRPDQGPVDGLRQGYGGPPKLHAKAEAGPHVQSKGPAKAGPHVRRGVPFRRIRWGVVWLCTAAYASHLLLDWLGSDPSWPAGIQALWPFSHRWFISGLNLFPYLERREMLGSTSILINIKAIAGEIVIVGPIVLVLGWLRSRRSAQRPRSPQRSF